MQMTMYTDYSLRVLMYLAERPNKHTTVNDVVQFYEVSHNHMMKVVQNLSVCGYVNTTRGRKGGISLAKKPQNINIGAVIKRTEKTMDIVECFDPQSNDCVIRSTCKLQGILRNAKSSFMAVLNDFTVADLLIDANVTQFVFQKNGTQPMGSYALDATLE